LQNCIFSGARAFVPILVVRIAGDAAEPCAKSRLNASFRELKRRHRMRERRSLLAFLFEYQTAAETRAEAQVCIPAA
jgi:hypothetical protein